MGKELGWLGLLQVPAAGLAAVRQRRSSDMALREATAELESLNTDEADDIARMLKKNPAAANKYVTSLYGSWDRMYAGVKSRSLLEDASEATRTALAGSPPVTPAEAARREIFLRREALGVPTTAAQINTLAPPRTATLPMLGINGEDWTPESMRATEATYKATGVPDYTLLVPRDPAGPPEGSKGPTGWAWDPNRKKWQPIPGTMAELDYTFNRYLDQMRAEVAEPGNGIDDMDSFLAAHADIRAWMMGYWREKAKDDPFATFMQGMLENYLRGQGVIPQGSPTSAGKGKPETRKKINEILNR